MLQYYLYSRHFPQTYIRQTFLSHEKEYRNQNEKMLFFSFIFVIIIIAGFSLAPDGVVFAGFCCLHYFRQFHYCFPLLTLVLFVFFFLDQRVKLSCPIALLKSFRFLE
jgi:hypothetical protein